MVIFDSKAISSRQQKNLEKYVLAQAMRDLTLKNKKNQYPEILNSFNRIENFQIKVNEHILISQNIQARYNNSKKGRDEISQFQSRAALQISIFHQNQIVSL
ncbi:unnamed protein product [Paramecium sonneborni]|uniref:Uncharacterized protein n=1 Tax=Paramecium sonneborni TaxID=65129 RepID=A0A8S1NAG0_9CILI|nr:unnamed protein product [Paramecium sonneborni]